MNKFDRSARRLEKMNELANRDFFLNKCNPIIKLVCALVYISVVVSLGRYEVAGVIIMFIPLFLIAEQMRIPIYEVLWRVKAGMIFVVLLGAAEPFLNKEVAFTVGIGVTYGMISMLTLILKGFLCLAISYYLAASTRVEDLGIALAGVGVPEGAACVLMMAYRYMFLLLEETGTMSRAYQLRTGRKKGVEPRAWGSFLGGLLLRSMDRAARIRDAMEIRGFFGNIKLLAHKKVQGKEIAAGIAFVAFVALLRFVIAMGWEIYILEIF